MEILTPDNFKNWIKKKTDFLLTEKETQNALGYFSGTFQLERRGRGERIVLNEDGKNMVFASLEDFIRELNRRHNVQIFETKKSLKELPLSELRKYSEGIKELFRLREEEKLWKTIYKRTNRGKRIYKNNRKEHGSETKDNVSKLPWSKTQRHRARKA